MTETAYIKLRYRGRLKNPDDVPQLIHETEDICRSNGWPYDVWDEDWSQPPGLALSMEEGAMHFEGHAPLKGISFSIGGSETVWLTFLPDGMLQSLFTLADPTFTANDASFPWQRVKTGFDGTATHLALCKLFRYLANKYFDVFEVDDESGYWHYQDDARFTGWMGDFQHAHQQLGEELAAIEADGSLSPEQQREMSYRVMKELVGRLRRGG